MLTRRLPWILLVSGAVMAQAPASPQQDVPSQPPAAQAPAPLTPEAAPQAPVGTGTLARSQAAPSSLPQRGILSRIAMIDIPGQPGFQAVALFDGKLLISHTANDSVDVFDIAKRRVIAQVKDMKGASGLVVDAASGKAYVANADANEIAVLSTKDWSVRQRIPLKAAPRSLLLVPELGTLYSANWHQRSLSAVDLKQGTSRTVAIDGSPGHLAFDPEQKRLYATLEDVRQVAVLSPELQVVKRYPIQGSQPTGILFDPTNRRLYVAVRYAVVSLDPDSGREVGRSAAPAGVDTLKLDGNRLYAAASGGVVLIYRVTGSGLVAEHEVTSDVKGHTLAYDAERGMILLPGGREGRSKLLLLRYNSGEQAPAVASRQ